MGRLRLYGPPRSITTLSFGEKYIYAICFVDHYTGYIQIYGMREKTAATTADCLRTFLADTAIFGPIYNLLSDGGGEYLGEVQAVCNERSIRQIKSAAPTTMTATAGRSEPGRV